MSNNDKVDEDSGVGEVDEIFDSLVQALMKCNEGELEEGLAICKEVLQTAPERPEAYFFTAIISFNLHDFGQAINMAQISHDLAPDVREYLEFLAVVSARAGRLPDAIYFAKVATAAESDARLAAVIPPLLLDFNAAMKAPSPSKHGLEGEGALNIGRFDVAFREFEKELRINPDNTMALIGLARSALLCSRPTQAIGALQNLIRLEPDDMFALSLLARALARSGRDTEARVAAMRAIERAAGDAEIYYQAMYALQTLSGIDIGTLKSLAVAFAEEFHRENDMDEVEGNVYPADRPIHIGYISNSFYRSEIADFTASWFGSKAPTKHVAIGYQQSIIADATTSFLRQGFNDWSKVHEIDPWTLALSASADGIDILVDLSHPDVDTKATLMGLSSSPVRVGVTALPEPGLMTGITHVLSDEVLAEADKNMLLDGQELITVKGTLFARPPFARSAEVTELPALVNGHVTFGAIAKLPQMSPYCAQLIGDILRETPNASLVLYAGDETSEQERLVVREFFLDAGVASRVFFADRDDEEDDAERSRDFGRLTVPTSYWQNIDILLDTTPMSGRAEVFEALWNGVPTVTLRGERRASSIAASIVAAANRPNWIARSSDQFVQIASELAADTDGLSDERAALVHNIATAPLFDTRTTSENIRAALLDVAKRHRKTD